MSTSPDVHTNVDLYAALLQGRMRGDDALEASQKLLQVLMDSSANAVFWKDRQSRYLGCNRVFAAFAGTEPDDLIGKSDRDMPWADDAEFGADWFIDWDSHVAETGEPVVGIVERLRRASGDLRWVETQKVPLRDLDGEVIGILGTFEDVTERRAAEERLNGTLKDLDKRVQQRTRDLERAIESLRREVDDRVRVQAEERQQRAYAEALARHGERDVQDARCQRGDGTGAHRRRATRVQRPHRHRAGGRRRAAGDRPLPGGLRVPEADRGRRAVHQPSSHSPSSASCTTIGTR